MPEETSESYAKLLMDLDLTELMVKQYLDQFFPFVEIPKDKLERTSEFYANFEMDDFA